MKRFRGGLVFQAHRLVYHSTPGWRVTKKKKKIEAGLDLVQAGVENAVLRRLQQDVHNLHAPHCEDRVRDGPASGGKGSKSPSQTRSSHRPFSVPPLDLFELDADNWPQCGLDCLMC